MLREDRFIDFLQNARCHALHQLVGRGRDTERTELAVLFRNIDSPNRQGTIGVLFELFTNGVKFLHGDGVIFTVYAGGSCSPVPADALRDLLPEIAVIGHQLKHALDFLPVFRALRHSLKSFRRSFGQHWLSSV